MAKTFQNSLRSAKTSVDRLGNTQLRVGKRFTLSGWLVFDGIALIIILSVAAVRLTHAGANYTFERTAQQMQGGELGRNIATGEYRRLVSNGIHAEAGAEVGADEMAASKSVCAQLHVNSKDTFVDVQINGHYASKFANTAGDVTICADVNHEAKAGTIYAGTSGNADVYSIYGVK